MFRPLIFRLLKPNAGWAPKIRRLHRGDFPFAIPYQQKEEPYGSLKAEREEPKDLAAASAMLSSRAGVHLI
jgi:hypothetical protein